MAATTSTVDAPERSFTSGLVEVRSGNGGRTIGGYGAVFNTLSRHLGFGFERVDPGFFNESRAAGWPGVVARWNHDSFHLLGSVHGATLRLAVDSRGLDYSCDLPECRNDLLELISRRDVNASSFAFTNAQDDWDYRDQHPVRTLLRGNLIDVAPVDVPAYPTGTSAALRSLARHVGAPIEAVLQRAERGELRGFFTRTDRPSQRRRPMTAAQAKMYMAGRRWPDEHRRDHTPPRRLTGRQARLYVMTRRPYDPIVPRTQHVSLPARSTRDPRQAKLLLHARIAGGW